MCLKSFARTPIELDTILNGTFPETLLNYLFNDLTSCHSSLRLSVVIDEIIKKEVEISDTPE